MSPDTPEEKAKRRVRQLIWLYFWLLLIEGALRKWVVPQLSNPLLIVRDPVMLAIYFYAIKARVFPKNGWTISLLIIGGLSVLAIVLSPLFDYLVQVPMQMAAVVGYGFRTNFMHLPLIFVMASVFDEEDVKKLGWWIIVMMIPMALIMAAQFKASPESFINRTAGLGEAEQLTAGGGKIRPPGTFSFISGPVFYMSVAAAFLIYGALTKAVYKNWLLIVSGLALAVGVFVSGSKSAVVSVLLVVAAVAAILILRRRAVNRFGWTLVTVVVLAVIGSRLPIFREGATILSDRFTSAAEATDTTVVQGTFERVFNSFAEGLIYMDKYPFWGFGLGVGTNVGGRILAGRPAFLLNENEWTRVPAEIGPVLGIAFLLWRTLFFFRLLWSSINALWRDSFLPILLFAAGGIVLLNGQLGQPTTLGFVVIANGLCLAAMQSRKGESLEPSTSAPTETRPLPRRSVYANRLHGPGIGIQQKNGSADR